jgi:hypothetical protein
MEKNKTKNKNKKQMEDKDGGEDGKTIDRGKLTW